MQCKNTLSKSSSLARARSRTPAPHRTGADDVFLFVKTHYGGSFKVDGVHASDTIDNVKAKIQDRLTNIPMSEMKLVQELEADGACGGVELGWYGIKRFGEVRMVPATSLAPRGEDTMPIFVHIWPNHLAKSSGQSLPHLAKSLPWLFRSQYGLAISKS
jgi:hypothetical protein